MSNRSREILVCDSHEDTEQDFAKLLRKDVPVFLASCPESPALQGGGGNYSKNNTQRGKQQGMKF